MGSGLRKVGDAGDGRRRQSAFFGRREGIAARSGMCPFGVPGIFA
jgi:hypothetical protein